MPKPVNDGGNPSQKQYPAIVTRTPGIALDILEDKEVYQKFKEKLKIALSKFPSSRKTKIVHQLIEKNIISIGIIHKSGSELPPVVMYHKDKTLHRIYLEPDSIDDTVRESKDLLVLLNELLTLNKKIDKEKKFVTDFQIYKIEEFQKNRKEVIEDIMSSIDWLKAIDLIYFGYLQLLGVLAADKNQPEKVKVFKTAEELLNKQIQKIMNKVDGNILKDKERKRSYNLGLQFFILTYFLQISNKATIDILKNHRGEWVNAALEDFAPESEDKTLTPREKEKKKEELANQRERINAHHKFISQELVGIKMDSFSKLAVILSKLGVLNISESTLKQQMISMVGQTAYELYYLNYPMFIALMANLNYKTQLFPKLFEVDKDLQKRLEELILNQKRLVVIKEKKI
jgi:hypothetical protein